MAINDYNGKSNDFDVDRYKYLVNVFINGTQLCCVAVDKKAKGSKQQKLFAKLIKKMDQLEEGEMNNLSFKKGVEITLKAFKKPDVVEDDDEEDDLFD